MQTFAIVDSGRVRDMSAAEIAHYTALNESGGEPQRRTVDQLEPFEKPRMRASRDEVAGHNFGSPHGSDRPR
jgi:hypothetical protein